MPEFKNEPFAPVQFANPVEQYQNILKTQYLASEIDKARRAEDDSTSTANAYKNALLEAKNPDGTVDNTKLRAGVSRNLITKGRGQLVPAYERSNAETDQATAKAGLDTASAAKVDADTLKTTMENMHTQYKGVSGDPHLGQQQMYAMFKGEAIDPALKKFNDSHGITPEQYLQRRVAEMQPAGQSPEAWRQYIIRQTMGAKEAADTLKKQIHVLDRGDKVDVIATDPNALDGQVKTLESVSKRMADHSVKVTVNANQKAANAFGETLGKKEAESYSNLEELARNADSTTKELDRIVGLISSGKVITGLGVNTKLDALRALKLAKGTLSPADEELLNNTQEVQKYLNNNVLERTAQLNKAGLGSRTSVQELKMMAEANARGDMEPIPALKVLLNQRKSVQNSIPLFNTRQVDVSNSPDLDPIQRTLASHPLSPIPDHPLAAHLVGESAATKVAPPAVVDALRNSKISKKAFDSVYGEGAADKAMRSK